MNFSFLPDYWAYFNYGVLVTLIIAVFVVVFGSILGVLLAFAQRSKYKLLVWFANIYVWIFRGTPMVVQIMIGFTMTHLVAPTFQLGILSVDLSRLIPGMVILSMNSGAYVSETVRAGINAVPKGQLEAAYSLGIRPHQAMRYVIMPQAIKNILPALGNEFVMMIKETSLASTFYIGELMTVNSVIKSATYKSIEPLVIVGLIYFIVTYSLSKLIKYMEGKLSVSD